MATETPVETEEQRKARLRAATPSSPPPLQPTPSPPAAPPPLAPAPSPAGPTPSGTPSPTKSSPTPSNNPTPLTPEQQARLDANNAKIDAEIARTNAANGNTWYDKPLAVLSGGVWGKTGYAPLDNLSADNILNWGGGFLNGGAGDVPNNYDAQKYLDVAQGQAGDVYNVAMENARRQQAVGVQPITAADVSTYGIGAERVATPGTVAGAEAADLRARQLAAVQGVATSPSAAAAQMDANLAKVARVQMGQAAMARGADRASARRDAMLATGTQGMEAASASAALAAQEKAERDRAALAGLAGVRAGDVSAGTVDLNAQEANQRAALAASQANQATDLQAQEMNQRAGLTADQANEANRLAAYDAQVRAQLGYLGTGLQATGAGTQAAGVAAAYETGINQAQTAKTSGLIGAGGAVLGSILSDVRAKQDIGGVGSAYASETAPGASPYPDPDDDPYAPKGQDFLAWQMPQTKAPEQKGLLQSILSDERAKQDIAQAAFEAGRAAGPKVEDVTPQMLDNRTPIWEGGNPDAYKFDEAAAQEKAKRDVEDMRPKQIQNWADTIDPITFRYKPGLVPGDEGEPRLGASAQQVERSGPLGRLMVHRDPQTGLRTLDYGAMSMMLSKAALERADEALARQKKGAR